MTSDMDSPGPFVGSYPFRNSASDGIDRSAVEAVALNGVISTDYGTVPTSLFSDIESGITAGDKTAFSSTTKLCNMIKNSVDRIRTNDKPLNTLVVGCKTGGVAYGLADALESNSVIGIDFDNKNIAVANKLLKSSENVNYTLQGEGELVTNKVVESKSDVTDANVQFRHADPLCMPAELAAFDLVVLDDVIDSTASPAGVLGRCGGMRGLVKTEGGMLVILTSYAWNSNITPKSLWIGGYQSAGEVVSGYDALKDKMLSEGFEDVSHEPFFRVGMTSENNFAGKILDMSVWRRK